MSSITTNAHTWLVGSPSRLHICGTILLRVKPWAPYLKNRSDRDREGSISASCGLMVSLPSSALMGEKNVMLYSYFNHFISLLSREIKLQVGILNIKVNVSCCYWCWLKARISRLRAQWGLLAQSWDETETHSLSGPVVFVFEPSQHSVP